jgi:hypothetical protein
VSRQQITLPSAVLRSTPLVLMGSGIGSANLISAAGEALHAAQPARLHTDATPTPLADVNQAWNAGLPATRKIPWC